jgi:HPt (histidine-containing phosphotransfer) domain-containing protein
MAINHGREAGLRIYPDLIARRANSPATTARGRFAETQTMAELAMQLAGAAPATPAIDRAHLKTMTFGDRSLEHELLHLFDRQAELLLARMRASDAATLAALAHTLKGSAAGIGAGEVKRAAEAAERAAPGSPAERRVALERLAAAIDAARADIAGLLRA